MVPFCIESPSSLITQPFFFKIVHSHEILSKPEHIADLFLYMNKEHDTMHCND